MNASCPVLELLAPPEAFAGVRFVGVGLRDVGFQNECHRASLYRVAEIRPLKMRLVKTTFVWDQHLRPYWPNLSTCGGKAKLL